MRTWIALLLFISTWCIYAFDTPNENSINLTGQWREIFDHGVPTENLIVFQIKHKEDQIAMSCKKKKHLSVSHIHLTDLNFTFQVTNSSNPSEPYIMSYNLTVDKKGNSMEGTVFTSKSEEFKVRLKRH